MKIQVENALAKQGGTGVQINANTYNYNTISENVGEQTSGTEWWPDKRPLTESLYERKVLIEGEEKSLIGDLREKLTKEKMIVIHPKNDSSGLTGFGGIGKTLTANWYAHCYESYYEKVVWINSGEKDGTVTLYEKSNLQKSFENLAVGLNVTNLGRLADIDQYTSKCFKHLEKFKCLWLFDNVDTYDCKNGIKAVLNTVKLYSNFHILITSRYHEWGMEGLGYGKIFSYPLDVFHPHESKNFLRTHFEKNNVECNAHQLEKLCQLLGNLPLALQLALATLKSNKMSVKEYVQRTSDEHAKYIVEGTCDDYEKTLRLNVSVAFEEIRKKRNGHLAYEIMKIFAYLQSEDVTSELFWLVANDNLITMISLYQLANISTEDVKNAINLLEEYALITKTEIQSRTPYKSYNSTFYRFRRIDAVEERMPDVSVHRLIQQVVRQIEKNTKYDTIKKILGCNGSYDLKLFPYMQANQKLKEKFANVKAHFVDLDKVIRLLRNDRYEEAVAITELISEDFKTENASFNYAICLGKHGDIDRSLEILKSLYNKPKNDNVVIKNMTDEIREAFGNAFAKRRIDNTETMGMVKMIEKLQIESIAMSLYSFQCKNQMYSEVDDVLANTMESIDDWLSILDEINISSYYLYYRHDNFKPKMLLDMCPQLNRKELRISGGDRKATTRIKLSSLEKFLVISLENCHVLLNSSKVFANRIKLVNVTIEKDGGMLKGTVDEWLSVINELNISSYYFSYCLENLKPKILLDVSPQLNRKEVHICGDRNFKTRFQIKLSLLAKVLVISLENCHVLLNSSNVFANTIKLLNVTIEKEGSMLKGTVDEWLSVLDELNISSYYFSYCLENLKPKILLDVSPQLNRKEVHICGDRNFKTRVQIKLSLLAKILVTSLENCHVLLNSSKVFANTIKLVNVTFEENGHMLKDVLVHEYFGINECQYNWTDCGSESFVPSHGLFIENSKASIETQYKISLSAMERIPVINLKNCTVYGEEKIKIQSRRIDMINVSLERKEVAVVSEMEKDDYWLNVLHELNITSYYLSNCNEKFPPNFLLNLSSQSNKNEVHISGGNWNFRIRFLIKLSLLQYHFVISSEKCHVLFKASKVSANGMKQINVTFEKDDDMLKGNVYDWLSVLEELNISIYYFSYSLENSKSKILLDVSPQLNRKEVHICGDRNFKTRFQIKFSLLENSAVIILENCHVLLNSSKVFANTIKLLNVTFGKKGHTLNEVLLHEYFGVNKSQYSWTGAEILEPSHGLFIENSKCSKVTEYKISLSAIQCIPVVNLNNCTVLWEEKIKMQSKQIDMTNVTLEGKNQDRCDLIDFFSFYENEDVSAEYNAEYSFALSGKTSMREIQEFKDSDQYKNNLKENYAANSNPFLNFNCVSSDVSFKKYLLISARFENVELILDSFLYAKKIELDMDTVKKTVTLLCSYVSRVCKCEDLIIYNFSVCRINGRTKGTLKRCDLDYTTVLCKVINANNVRYHDCNGCVIEPYSPNFEQTETLASGFTIPYIPIVSSSVQYSIQKFNSYRLLDGKPKGCHISFRQFKEPDGEGYRRHALATRPLEMLLALKSSFRSIILKLGRLKQIRRVWDALRSYFLGRLAT